MPSHRQWMVKQVDFLDACGAVGRHAEVDIGVAQQLGDLAAALAGQGDDAHAVFVRGVDRLDHVGRVARGRDGQQHVAG